MTSIGRTSALVLRDCLFSIALACAAAAQTAGPSVHLYGRAGLALPFGALTDQSNFGYNGAVGIGAAPFHAVPDLEVRLFAELGQFPRREERLESVKCLDGRLGCKLNVRHDNRVIPYLLLGAGYARVTIDYGSASSKAGLRKSEHQPLAYAGMGVEMGQGKMRWFLEGTATDISGGWHRDYQFLTISIGIRL
jgi:hypothetical protein